MSNILAEISLEITDQLEQALLKEASLTARVEILEQEKNNLISELSEVKKEAALQKQASNSFDAAMLSATSSLEQVGFFSPGTAVLAYKTLTNNHQEIPVLLEKLAGAISAGFEEGKSFEEKTILKSASEQANPWLALIDE